MLPVLLFVPLLFSTLTYAESSKLSGEQRQEIIRAFLDERAYAHRALPVGKAGMVIEGSMISPSEGEVLQLGAAARAGERVQITGVRFLRGGILFEINGGAVKHEKWSERIRVGMGPNLGPSRQPDENRPGKTGSLEKDSPEKVFPETDGSEAKGASVLLKLDDSTGITAGRVRTLLAPVLDFSSTSQEEAYQKNLSPVLAAALRDHHALVGMDRDMVLAALGRPSRRLRENAEGQEYEEWIYGSPPQEVHFIRFVRGKVVRIEQMKVTGEKLVRTEDEVGKIDGVLDASQPQYANPGRAGDPAAPPSGAAPAMAAPQPQEANDGPAGEPGKGEREKPPTLLRPGEPRPSN